MDVRLEEFRERYRVWVAEKRSDFEAGRLANALESYPYLVYRDTPWSPYRGEASAHTFAIVTSGGLYLKDLQPPFDAEGIDGDASLRTIPKTVQPRDLAISHPHYDHSLAEEDIGCVFPLKHFLDLEAEGTVGGVAPTHYSLSYVNDVVPLAERTAPAIVENLRREGVTALFMVPV
jgi:D-proline reductase (dithiol) PrdB